MMNPTYHFQRMRDLIEEFEPSRERSLATTKLDEAEMWLARCKPTAVALGRDQEQSRNITDGRAAVARETVWG
jgi:hypothetical protein